MTYYNSQEEPEKVCGNCHFETIIEDKETKYHCHVCLQEAMEGGIPSATYVRPQWEGCDCWKKRIPRSCNR